jgi:hemolysin III
VTLEQPDWLLAAKRRPRFRGVLHQYTFFVSVALGALLVLGARGGVPRVSALVFATSVAAMLGVSALYHRVVWPPGPRRWMRRLDHAAIFLLIAGTYTPFALVALDGAWRVVMLAIAWSGALAAIVLKVAWIDGPRWVAAVVAVCLGWVGVVMVPEIHGSVGFSPLALVAVGGLLYTAGGVIYALRRPDPLPSVFGYHELFHALVVAAAGFQYVAVALFVL